MDSIKKIKEITKNASDYQKTIKNFEEGNEQTADKILHLVSIIAQELVEANSNLEILQIYINDLNVDLNSRS